MPDHPADTKASGQMCDAPPPAFSCSGQSVLDSDEYSLWAAFMKSDSPPSSPCPSPVDQGAASAFPRAEEEDDGAEAGESAAARAKRIRKCFVVGIEIHPELCYGDSLSALATTML